MSLSDNAFNDAVKRNCEIAQKIRKALAKSNLSEIQKNDVVDTFLVHAIDNLKKAGDKIKCRYCICTLSSEKSWARHILMKHPEHTEDLHYYRC